MKSILALLLFLCVSASHAQVHAVPDALLQARIDSLAQGFKGQVGIYVRHVPSGRTASVQAERLFPTASMIKVPIMLKIFDLIDKGELDYHADLIYRDSLLVPGVDILGSFKDGEPIPLSKVVLLSITTSDNTAARWLQILAGKGDAINDWLASRGFTSTHVNGRTPGRESDYDLYGWGQTTPREMSDLLLLIRDGKAVSPAADDEMYRVLTRIYWNDEALGFIPPWVQVASKQGAVNQSRSEAVLVNAPHGDYVFTVITSDQEDTRWTDDNEGNLLIRSVSRLLWNYFEPESNWSRPRGTERY